MIDLQKDGGLWVVTLNRPDKANSLTAHMLETLCDIIEGANTGPDAARVLVLTGTGRVFSAGADLDEARAGLAISPLWERLSSAVAAFEGLSIAALNGTLAGGAFGMVLACDLRISAPGAKFFYPVMKLGFLPQPSDPARMRALIGPSRSKLILMGGQKIIVDQALMFGLVDRVIEGDVVEEARNIAADTLAANPEIATGIKAMCL